MNQSIGIIGGTGKQGTGLAKRCANAGFDVLIGSRSADRGKEHAEALCKTLNTESITGGNNEYATSADVVVLAIPFDQVETLLTPLKDNLKDKIVLDMTVNLEFGKFIKTNLENGKSSYEYIREFLPTSDVVACLKTISYLLLDDMEEINQTDFQITLSDQAYEFTSDLVRKFGLDPVRVRGKMHAHSIERMVALSIQLNKEYKGSHTGYKLVNLNK